jgi:hypothetical protein
VPELAAQTEAVPRQLDHLLEDEPLYHLVRADLVRPSGWGILASDLRHIGQALAA